jgi:hypothetical protein
VDSELDKRRFVAALIGGQSCAVLALLLFGGVLWPMTVAFLGSAAGPLLLARR